VGSHERAPRKDLDSAAAIEGIILENARSLQENPVLFAASEVEELTRISLAQLRRNRDLLLARRERGYVRRCHGDLHLRNVVLIGGEPVLFDALEFDEAMATSDVLYDLAFLIMDLWERGFHEAANALFNRYLWLTLAW
jgi:aminoglycoside phosphotransferase family enzyme